MKRTQILDARRNIRKEIVAYLSIVIIGMLASLSYLAITYSAATLKKDALRFFNGYGLWDLEAASTMLMDEGDLEAIRALPGVSEAEAVWQIDGKLRGESGETAVTLISLSDTISRPRLLEGRLPEKAGECAVEKELLDRCALSIGQSVSPETKPLSGVEPLAEQSFVITGVFQTPDHVTYMIPVTPYILVTEDSFNRSGLEGAFMKVRVRVEGTPEQRYGDAYREKIAPVEEAINAIADERAALRADKMREGVDERISEGRARLDEARQQLDDGRRQYEEGRAELESKRAELEEGRAKLEDGRRQYEEGRAELESKRAELEEGRAKLEDGRRQFEEGRAELESRRAEFEEGLARAEEGRRQLEEGRAQLADARAKLDEGWKAVREAEPQLRDARDQLDWGGTALAEAEYQLSAVPGLYASALSALTEVESTTGPFLPDELRGVVQAYKEGMNAYGQGRMLWYYKGEEYLDALALYEKNVKQLEQGEEEYEKGKAALEENEQKLLDGEAQLHDGEQALRDGERQLLDAEAELKDGEAQFREAEQAFRDGERQLLDAEAGLKDGEAQLREAEQAFRDGEQQLLDAEAELKDGEAQLCEAEQAFRDGERQLLDAEAELQDGERQVRDGERELRDAEALRDGAVQGRWVVIDDMGNPGFIYARDNADKLASLSMSFSMIFLVVGALVIYATIGRMVEEQRVLIGATKAMGFYNREVFEKYLYFACTATMLGVGAGILLAWGPLQRAVLKSYEELLCYGEGTRSFLLTDTALVAVGAFLISLAAVYLGCSQLLRLPAIRLMQGDAPASGGKKSGKSAKRNLYYRLIFRNMRTDWSRVLVTIVSVAGGCVLMVVGFTLRYGISGVPDRQFGGILTYEAEVFFDSGVNGKAASEIEAVLEENGLDYITLRKADGVFEVDSTLNALTLVAAEKGSLEGYFALKSLDGDETIELPDSGVLVPRRFWEHYPFDVGDRVSVYDSSMNRSEILITDVFENYYGQLFFLSPESYEEIFGLPPQTNCFFVKTGGMTITALREKLAGIGGVLKVNDAWAERHMIEQFTAGLNFVVWLMLFIAGMMACFIVANFTMTYIQRKTRELTIMRINGFSVRECTRYVAVDLVVTTVLGIALGLVLGRYLGHAILRTTETPYIQMIREDAVQSYLFSALITGGFSLLTNSFALQKIKKLKLSDII